MSALIVILLSVTAGQGYCLGRTVPPSLSVSPNPAWAGHMVTITGHNFNVSTFGTGSVSIYTEDTPPFSENLKSDGSFSTTHTYTMPGTYTITAKDSKGNSASTTLTVTAPTLSINPSSFRVGDTVSITGQNYPTGTPLLFHIDNQLPSIYLPASSVDASGSLSYQGRTWDVFGYLYPGNHKISVSGSDPVLVTVGPMPAPSISPNPVLRGKQVKVTGQSVEKGAKVSLILGNGILTETTADANGFYQFAWHPETAGSYTIKIQSEQIDSDMATMTVIEESISTPTPTSAPTPTATQTATPSPTSDPGPQASATPLPAVDQSTAADQQPQSSDKGSDQHTSALATSEGQGISPQQPGTSTSSGSTTAGDAIAPVTIIVLNGTVSNATGTYTSDVVVTLNASDDAAGSGVKETQYSFDNTKWIKYTAPFTVFTEGVNTVYARSVDNAGNIETANLATFSIAHTSTAKSKGFCGAALLPLLLVGMAALGTFRKHGGQ